MEKNNKSRREQLIEAYRLTKEEIAYLDLCHTDTGSITKNLRCI